jgi:hypothetical protein
MTSEMLSQRLRLPTKVASSRLGLLLLSVFNRADYSSCLHKWAKVRPHSLKSKSKRIATFPRFGGVGAWRLRFGR